MTEAFCDLSLFSLRPTAFPAKQIIKPYRFTLQSCSQIRVYIQFPPAILTMPISGSQGWGEVMKKRVSVLKGVLIACYFRRYSFHFSDPLLTYSSIRSLRTIYYDFIFLQSIGRSKGCQGLPPLGPFFFSFLCSFWGGIG